MVSHNAKNSDKNHKSDNKNTAIQALPTVTKLPGVIKPKTTKKRSRQPLPPTAPLVVPTKNHMTRSKGKKSDDFIQMGEVLCMCSPAPNNGTYCPRCHKLPYAVFKMLFKDEFEEVTKNMNKLAAALKIVSDPNALRNKITMIQSIAAKGTSSNIGIEPGNFGGNTIAQMPNLTPERLFVVNKDQEIAITNVCSLSGPIASDSKNGKSLSVKKKTPSKKTKKDKNNPSYTKDKIIEIVLKEIAVLEEELLGCIKAVERGQEEGHKETKIENASIVHRGCLKIMRRIVILQERLSKKPKNEILKMITDRLAILNQTPELK